MRQLAALWAEDIVLAVSFDGEGRSLCNCGAVGGEKQNVITCVTLVVLCPPQYISAQLWRVFQSRPSSRTRLSRSTKRDMD
jgi:hypothetical protein